MRFLSYIIWLVVIILGLTFASLNAEPVNLNYYFGARTVSLSLLLVLCLGFGMLLGLLIALMQVLRLKLQNHRLQKQIGGIEKNLP